MKQFLVLFLCISIYLGMLLPNSVAGPKERYCSPEYGYCVLIPSGALKQTDAPPLPQHGFRLALRNSPTSYVWVDAGYNTLGWSTLQEAFEHHLEWLKQEGSNLALVNQKTASFNRLQTLRSVVRYDRIDTGELMMQDLILAERPRRNQTGIVYTFGLRTPASRYDKDKQVLEKTIESWKLTALPH